jgi:hypothetical protein
MDRLQRGSGGARRDHYQKESARNLPHCLRATVFSTDEQFEST